MVVSFEILSREPLIRRMNYPRLIFSARWKSASVLVDQKPRSTLANSEDPDEIPHDAAFHQGLHYFLLQCQSSEKYNIYGEIIACDPLRYKMDHPDFIIHVALWKLSLVLNRVRTGKYE